MTPPLTPPARWHFRAAQDSDDADMQGWHARRLRQAWGVPPDGDPALDAFIRQQCAWRDAAYAAAHGRDGCLVLVDEADPGHLLGRLWTSRQGEHWHLVDLIIAPAARRKGLARACLSWLQTQTDHLSLDVDADNHAARRLYEQAGFRPQAQRGPDLHLSWQRTPSVAPSTAAAEMPHEQA